MQNQTRFQISHESTYSQETTKKQVTIFMVLQQHNKGNFLLELPSSLENHGQSLKTKVDCKKEAEVCKYCYLTIITDWL